MKRRKLHYAWIVCAACSVNLLFIFGLTYSTPGVYLKAICEAGGFSRSQYSFMMTMQTLLYGTAGLFSAKVGAKIGFRAMIASAGLASGAGLLCWARAGNLAVLYLGGALTGCGLAFGTLAPVSILLSRWFEKSYGLAIGIAMAGTGIGGMVFSPIILHAISVYGYRTPLYASAALVAVVVAASSLCFIRESPQACGFFAYGAESKPFPNAQKQPLYGMTMSEAFHTAAFWLNMAHLVLISICVAGALFIAPSHLDDIGLGSFAAVTLSALYLSNACGKILMGAVNDRFGAKTSAIYSSILFTAAMAFSLGAQKPWIALCFAIPFGLSVPAATLIKPIMIRDAFGNKDYANLVALFTSVGNLSGAIAMPMAGFIYDRYATYVPAIAAFALMAMGSGVLAALVYRRPKTMQEQ